MAKVLVVLARHEVAVFQIALVHLDAVHGIRALQLVPTGLEHTLEFFLELNILGEIETLPRIGNIGIVQVDAVANEVGLGLFHQYLHLHQFILGIHVAHFLF